MLDFCTHFRMRGELRIITYIEEFALYIRKWKFSLLCLAGIIEKFYSTKGRVHNETRVAYFECADLLSDFSRLSPWLGVHLAIYNMLLLPLLMRY